MDLSNCVPGQKLRSKHGMILTYVGPFIGHGPYQHEIRYPDGSHGSRMNDGFTYHNPNARLPEDHDIVEILPLEFNTPTKEITMKIKTYDEAFKLVYDATAAIINCSELIYPQCYDDDMTITITSEHSDRVINIHERNNEFVEIKEGNLVFLDSEENKIIIQLLDTIIVT